MINYIKLENYIIIYYSTLVAFIISLKVHGVNPQNIEKLWGSVKCGHKKRRGTKRHSIHCRILRLLEHIPK